MINLNRNLAIEDFEIVTKVDAPKDHRTIHLLAMTIMFLEIALVSTTSILLFTLERGVIMTLVNGVLVIIIMLVLRRKYVKAFSKEFHVIPPYTCYGLFERQILDGDIEWITQIRSKLLTNKQLEDSYRKRYFNYEPVKLRIVKPFTWAKKSVGNSFIINNIEIVVTVFVFSSKDDVEWYLKEVGTDEININDINLLVYNSLTKVLHDNIGSFLFSPTTDKKEDMIQTLKNQLFGHLNRYAISINEIDIRYPGQYDINIV
jgi:hypothetical protein